MSDNLPVGWDQGLEDGVQTIELVKKDDLVGVPFLVHSIRVSQGDFGEMYTVEAEDANGGQFIFHDGSTGVARQLAQWLAGHRDRQDGQLGTWDCRFVARKGLRVSRYANPNGDGLSSTYYIA